MSSTAAIRTAIANTLRSVEGIGVVHEYERSAKDEATMRRLYQPPGHANGPINGWFIRRARLAEAGRLIPDSVEVIRWQIHGVYSQADGNASELAFDALVDRIRDAIRANDTLIDPKATAAGATVAMCAEPNDDGPAGIQIDDAGPAMFCGVLVHACRLTLPTTRYLQS